MLTLAAIIEGLADARKGGRREGAKGLERAFERLGSHGPRVARRGGPQAQWSVGGTARLYARRSSAEGNETTKNFQLHFPLFQLQTDKLETPCVCTLPSDYA